MRNLTIYRRSAAAGRLAKMNVFIEDPNSDELVLLDHHYRKLGDLKNDEAKTFEIPEDAAKIILISEREDRNLRWSYYMLGQGAEHVELSGKTTLEKGGQFVFEFDKEGVKADQSALKKRHTKRRCFIRVLIIALCILMLRSCKAEPKTFTVENLNLPLTTAFQKETPEDSLAKFVSKKVNAYVYKEIHIFYNTRNLSVEEYAKLIADNVDVDATITKNANGWATFNYKRDLETIEASHHFVYVYKTTNSFWVVEFVTPDRHSDKCSDDIAEWANSMYFTE